MLVWINLSQTNIYRDRHYQDDQQDRQLDHHLERQQEPMSGKINNGRSTLARTDIGMDQHGGFEGVHGAPISVKYCYTAYTPPRLPHFMPSQRRHILTPEQSELKSTDGRRIDA
jgi:hypothetical protein